MSTRTIPFTAQERILLGVLLENAWLSADQARMDTRPDSPQEKQAEDYQILIANIQAKLRGATSEI